MESSPLIWHLRDKMFYSLWRPIDEEVKTFVVVNEQFIVWTRDSITERSAILSCVTWLHPQTHGELCQTGHAPDVNEVSSDVSGWKIESVVCNKRNKNLTTIIHVLCRRSAIRFNYFHVKRNFSFVVCLLFVLFMLLLFLLKLNCKKLQ